MDTPEADAGRSAVVAALILHWALVANPEVELKVTRCFGWIASTRAYGTPRLLAEIGFRCKTVRLAFPVDTCSSMWGRTDEPRGGGGVQWAAGHWMCVSELMLALGQADLCGKFTYGKPWLMRSLATQLDLALARTMRRVGAEEEASPPTSSEEESSLEELAGRLWEHRSRQQAVDSTYNSQSCKALANLLAVAPSSLLPRDHELRWHAEAEEDGVTCCLEESFGDRIATLLPGGYTMPGLLHDAVLVGPCLGSMPLSPVQLQQADSFPPWRTPPSQWADDGCPVSSAVAANRVRIGLPRFSKAPGHGTL